MIKVYRVYLKQKKLIKLDIEAGLKCIGEGLRGNDMFITPHNYHHPD